MAGSTHAQDVVLVTGAGRGIGKAIADAHAEAGAKVIYVDFDTIAAEEAAAAARDRDLQAIGLGADVAHEGAVNAAVAKGIEAFGPITALINNAGISPKSQPGSVKASLWEMPASEWQRVVDVNLTAAFVIGREAGKRMLPRKAGKIINIGSLMSDSARATVSPYTAAKAGIKALTQVMAAEWAEHGIQANAIGPGYMLTEMNTALVENPTFNAWVVGRTPSRRWGKPEELIGAAVFLASSASDYVNGQIIYVDGGMMAVL